MSDRDSGRGRHPRGRWLLRGTGAFFVADGMARTLGGGGLLRLPLVWGQRRVGASELVLALMLLDRAPIEPALLYRVAAPVYDWLSPIWWRWLYGDAGRAFDAATASAVRPEGDVLDLGCGTGAILDRLDAGGVRFHSYTGVDLSEAMLTSARAKHGGLPGVRFERLDLRREPLPAGPFDLVVSAWAPEHLARPDELVAAARDRLAPDGRVVLLFELDRPGPLGWPLRRLWRFFGVRLLPGDEARAWPGLLTFRRWAGPGLDVALAVLGGPPPEGTSSARDGPTATAVIGAAPRATRDAPATAGPV